MELAVFARLYAREGQQDALAAALVAHLGEVRATPGCLAIHDYRSIRDTRLLYIHSRWTNEAAFEKYARSPETDRFVEQVEKRMDRPPLEATRARSMVEGRSTAEARKADLFIFARLRARAGKEDGVAAALSEVHGPTAQEAGCSFHDVYRSIRDPRLHYVYSGWQDEATFGRHIDLPHTVRFVELVEKLIGHPLEVTRARVIG